MKPRETSTASATWVAIAVAVIALVGVISAAVIAKYYRAPNLKLVDVNISEVPTASTHGGFVMSRYGLSTLDLLMKNDGDRTAVASGVELEIKDVWRLVRQFPLDNYLGGSHDYSIELDPTRSAPYTRTVAISQSVKGDEADHISVSLGLNPMKPFESIYHISVRLIYNSNQRSNPVDVILVLPDLAADNPPYFLSDYYTELNQLLANQKVIEEYRRKNHKKAKEEEPIPIDSHDKEEDDKDAHKIDAHNRDVIYKAAQVAGKHNVRASALIAQASATGTSK